MWTWKGNHGFHSNTRHVYRDCVCVCVCLWMWEWMFLSSLNTNIGTKKKTTYNWASLLCALHADAICHFFSITSGWEEKMTKILMENIGPHRILYANDVTYFFFFIFKVCICCRIEMQTKLNPKYKMQRKLYMHSTAVWWWMVRVVRGIFGIYANASKTFGWYFLIENLHRNEQLVAQRYIHRDIEFMNTAMNYDTNLISHREDAEISHADSFRGGMWLQRFRHATGFRMAWLGNNESTRKTDIIHFVSRSLLHTILVGVFSTVWV